MNTNGKENVDLVAEVDRAMNTVTQPATTSNAQPGQFATPEEYRLATGKRFRMTKEEQTKFGFNSGGDPEANEKARLAAFLERQGNGTL